MALSTERRELLDSLVESGTTIEKMHREHGFNHATVRKYYPLYRTRANYVFKDTYDLDPEVRKFVYALIDDGASVAEIVRSANVTEGQVDWLQPGYGWTKSQAAKAAVMSKEFNLL